MNILGINGSPKGLKSNTNSMMQALLKGFESSNSKISNIFLSEKQIDYCKGCYSCWFKTPGKCIINDDMEYVINIMKKSEIIIFGSPLYFNNISGNLKVFFDRLTAMGGDPHKNSNKNENKKKTSFIMISNCGFPYRSQFDVISLWINNVVKMLQVDLIGEFYTTDGKILTQPDKNQVIHRNNYLEYLTACGSDFLNNGRLSDDLKALLGKGILEF
jgi:multimeric flavodoxin WrbA